MSDGQIFDIVHADDTVKRTQPDIVLVLFLGAADVDRYFIFVHEIDHLGARKRIAKEVVVEVQLSFTLV